MSKRTAKKVREEVLEVWADEAGNEYVACAECQKKGLPQDVFLKEAYLLTLNTKSSSGGKFAKTKCRDCSITNDGIGEAAREIGKLLTNIIPPITIKL